MTDWLRTLAQRIHKHCFQISLQLEGFQMNIKSLNAPRFCRAKTGFHLVLRGEDWEEKLPRNLLEISVRTQACDYAFFLKKIARKLRNLTND